MKEMHDFGFMGETDSSFSPSSGTFHFVGMFIPDLACGNRGPSEKPPSLFLKFYIFTRIESSDLAAYYFLCRV